MCCSCMTVLLYRCMTDLQLDMPLLPHVIGVCHMPPRVDCYDIRGD